MKQDLKQHLMAKNQLQRVKQKKMKIKNGEVSALVELPKERVGEAAELAAAAFLHSPGYCYIFEGLSVAQRRRALKWLFVKNFTVRHGSGVARCAFAEGGEMACFFMIQTPESGEVGAWTMLRHGILDAVPRFGLRPFFRLLEVKGYHERLERAFVADQRKQQEAFLKSLGNTELPGFFDDEQGDESGGAIGDTPRGACRVSMSEAEPQCVFSGEDDAPAPAPPPLTTTTRSVTA